MVSLDKLRLQLCPHSFLCCNLQTVLYLFGLLQLLVRLLQIGVRLAAFAEREVDVHFLEAADVLQDVAQELLSILKNVLLRNLLHFVERLHLDVSAECDDYLATLLAVIDLSNALQLARP